MLLYLVKSIKTPHDDANRIDRIQRLLQIQMGLPQDSPEALLKIVLVLLFTTLIFISKAVPLSSLLLHSNETELSNRLVEGDSFKMSVPSLQKPAPLFKGTAVVGGMFKDISLEDYRGHYVVLLFYPLDFTFVCPTEIIAFSDAAEEFRKIKTAIVACSTDSQFCHLAWINTPRKMGGLGEMAIPLLSDKSGSISKSYGVLDENTGIPYRGLFIIDGKGTLRQITINDLPVGRSVDEVFRLVQAFKMTDESGEVCPIGWRPGAKTIKPDPTASKLYFAAVN